LGAGSSASSGLAELDVTAEEEDSELEPEPEDEPDWLLEPECPDRPLTTMMCAPPPATGF